MTNPVFLIKTRMSLQMREKIVDGRPHYTSIRHAFMQIYRDEGFAGFYKGRTYLRKQIEWLCRNCSSIVCSLTWSCTICCIWTDEIENVRLENSPRQEFRISMCYQWVTLLLLKYLQSHADVFIAGSVGKLAATFATHPFQVVKSRLQVFANAVNQRLIVMAGCRCTIF